MARLQSQALGGYFKTQDDVRPLIYRRIAAVTTLGSYAVVDPCAGDGEALCELVDTIFGVRGKRLHGPLAQDCARVDVSMVELEKDRYEAAQQRKYRTADGGTTLHGDGLCCDAKGSASLLWLNPPYDFFRGQRFEVRFLNRWTGALGAGGVLVLIIPEYVVADVTPTLTRHYDDVEVLKYPEPTYSDFKQVVILATKRALENGDAAAITLARGELSDAPTTLRTLPGGSLTVHVHTVDVRGILAAAPAWCGQAGYDRPATPPKVGLAMRPKPAHVAMALGSGIFNGVRLRATGRPDLLAKAVFVREYQDVKAEEKTNADGEVVKRVQVERPRLTLTTLNLEDGTFVALDPGTTPSGGDEIKNFADLLLVYGGAMVSAMQERCPALHEGDRVDLAPMHRKSYEAQHHASVAAIKLMHRGYTPLILGELGAGKTQVAYEIMWALAQSNIAATSTAIRRSPCADSNAFPTLVKLNAVRRVLVVCPPHLCQVWIDEARNCHGSEVPVVELRTVGDVDKFSKLPGELVVAVLSRDFAKLGHGVEGIGTARCPRCNHKHGSDGEKLAQSRAVCAGELVEPLDAMARVAHEMWKLRRRGVAWGSAAFDHARRAAAVLLLRRLWLKTTRLKETWQSKRVRLDWEAEKTLIAALRLVAPDSRVLRCLKASKIDTHGFLLKDFAHAVDDATLCTTLAGWGRWKRSKCAEPLYQAVPTPRRYPVAEYVCRRFPTLFDMLVVDEFHEYSNAGSAQASAIHRLVEKIPYVLPLTGSLMNGYAKSLFANLWAVSPRMREEFDHGDAAKFAKLYGYQKRVLTGDAAKQAKVTQRGASSDRVVKTEGGERTQDAPGVLPSFVLRHVLPLSVTLHKRDINPDERIVDHDRVEVPWGDDVGVVVRSRGAHLGSKLIEAVKKDRSDEKLAGKLFGQLAELPSYYDRASADSGNTVKEGGRMLPMFWPTAIKDYPKHFEGKGLAGSVEGHFAERCYEIRYPADVGGAVVAEADGIEASSLLPKERWLVETLHRELAQNRRCLIFLWHKDLAARLCRIVEDATHERPAFLDADKVPARKRQEWIDKNVVGKRKVLITNPSCVQTGLNNLIWFSTAIFVENPGCNPFIARQAVGRLDRITQTEEVRIYWPVYEGVQAKVLDLLQTKSAISQQIDGIDPTAALEMAGGGGGSEVESMDVGLAIYKYLGGD